MQTISQQKHQYKHQQRQKGFVLLLVIVVIAIIASLWISVKHQSLISIFKTHDINADFSDIELVKDRLLEYAALHPEIYTTDGDDDVDYRTASQIPAPGYFPCPDLNGDGQLLGAETGCFNPFNPGGSVPDEDNTGFVPDSGVLGFVPSYINTHHIHFAEPGRYYYFVDERFVAQNTGPDYINDDLKRYAPMNPLNFVGDISAAVDNLSAFEPLLTLNGKSGYIALVIDAGNDGLDVANNLDAADGLVDRHFISGASVLSEDPNADKIVGITYSDWNNAINRRLCIERFRYKGLEYADEDGDGSPDEVNPFTEIADDIKHWYNEYVYTGYGAAGNNPGGTNWRSTSMKCKYDY